MVLLRSLRDVFDRPLCAALRGLQPLLVCLCAEPHLGSTLARPCGSGLVGGRGFDHLGKPEAVGDGRGALSPAGAAGGLDSGRMWRHVLRPATGAARGAAATVVHGALGQLRLCGRVSAGLQALPGALRLARRDLRAAGLSRWGAAQSDACPRQASNASIILESIIITKASFS